MRRNGGPPFPRKVPAWRLLVLPLLVILAGCEDSTAPQTSQVQIQLTDAPAEAIASAQVWISRVFLKGCETEGEGEEECLDVDLFNDPETPRTYDLLTLQDGITADLTDPVEVEVGIYHQLRMKVDSAVVTLAEGYSFADGTLEAVLKVTGGGTIKVRLDQPIDAEADELTVVLVDFDVDRNFVFQGGGTGNVFNGVLFTPTLNELGRTKSGN